MAGCPLLALSGHGPVHCTCPLLGVKRTCLFALHMSAFGGKADINSGSAGGANGARSEGSFSYPTLILN